MYEAMPDEDSAKTNAVEEWVLSSSREADPDAGALRTTIQAIESESAGDVRILRVSPNRETPRRVLISGPKSAVEALVSPLAPAVRYERNRTLRHLAP